MRKTYLAKLKSLRPEEEKGRQEKRKLIDLKNLMG
jgi:hypothetical protein